jgi:hypothetical protein
MEIHFCMQIQKVRRRTLFSIYSVRTRAPMERCKAKLSRLDLDSMFFKGFEVPPPLLVNMQMFERENSIGCNHSWGLLFAARVRRLPLNFVCARAHMMQTHKRAVGVAQRARERCEI